MRKYFLFIFILLCVSFTGCAKEQTMDKLVKNNQQVFFSDNSDWLLTYSKEVTEKNETSSREKKEYKIKFLHEINKKKNQSEVEITDLNSGEIVYSGDFEGFILFIEELQKNFYSKRALYKMSKEDKNLKVTDKGSPYAKRKAKKNVYDEITAQQTVIVKNGKQKAEITITLTLEKDF